MNKTAVAYFITFLTVSSTLFASGIGQSIESKLATPNFSVGIGSTINLKSSDKLINGKNLFLGKAISPSGENTFQIFLNLESKKINLIDASEFNNNNNLQTILDPYEQTGGTCTGYAIFDFLEQTNLSKFNGTGELSKKLSNEEGRTQLLADSINQYYLVTQHKFSINGIMNSFGKTYGFKCKDFKTDSYEKAKTEILKNLKNGLPIIFSFNIGPKMAKAPFEMELYSENNKALDNRLWIPRKSGERNSGGHSIVATASFELENKTYLVMIDSDWTEPRIWDLESFLGGKTAIDEVEFISCK